MAQSRLNELSSHCIRCGFCLEACPTFKVNGEETESPRGRIYLARSADEGVISWESTRPHLDQCLGCRACEPACPSGVQYGKILELARQHLETRRPNFTRRALIGIVSSPWLLRLTNLFRGRKLPSVLAALISPQKQVAETPIAQVITGRSGGAIEVSALKGRVAVLDGCAMGVFFRGAQQATRNLLRRVGYDSDVITGCCGALHAHNGQLDAAEKMAKRIGEVAGQNRIVLDSAGCGSWLKEALGANVIDITEFLHEQRLMDLLRKSPGVRVRAAYHDACHLAHGQLVTRQPRELLAAIPGIELVDLNEPDMCCGSAGIYNLTQPEMAKRLLDRKWANIEASGAEVVVMGNPGCHAWIEQASRNSGGRIRVMHTCEMLEASFSGLPGNAG